MQDSSIEGVGSTLGKFLEMYSRNLSLSGVMSTMSLDSGLMFGPVWRQIFREFLEKTYVSLKVRKFQKAIAVSSILPKNQRKNVPNFCPNI